MEVIGVTSPVGSAVTRVEVRHGTHPEDLLYAGGYVPLRPLYTALVDGEIRFTFLVRPVTVDDPRPRHRRVKRTPPRHGETPVARQRIGAYAVVTSPRGVLGTVNSSLTGSPGTWALPGGGVDPGESPAEAVLREIYEETGQQPKLNRVLSLESDRWIGRSVGGELEDFHALRIIYSAECSDPTEPVVHDVGGSTHAAEWVPLRRWRHLNWTMSSRALLTRYLTAA